VHVCLCEGWVVVHANHQPHDHVVGVKEERRWTMEPG